MDAGRNLIAIRKSFTIVDEDGCIADGRGQAENVISPCEADSNAVLIDIACNYHDSLVAASEAVTGSAIIGEILAEPERIEVDYTAWLTLIQLLEEIEEVRKVEDR
jgi:hypothetical protein